MSTNQDPPARPDQDTPAPAVNPGRFSYLFSTGADYLEYLLEQYRNNPDALPRGWQHFFDGYQIGTESGPAVEEPPTTPAAEAAPAPARRTEFDPREFKVINLIHGYRTRGHLFTRTNPVRTRRRYRPTLDLENFGLQASDLDDVFQAGSEIGIGPARLRDIVDHLQETYCKSIGAEYMFIRTPEKVRWLQERMESTRNRPAFSLEEKREILENLNRAVTFENYLHSKFIGQKRFSLCGGETLAPALDALIEKGAAKGVEEVILGMAHRGRINILANILRKPYKSVFEEFEGKAYEDDVFVGDVKYHLGYANVIKTRSGNPVNVNLSSNPSHLEAADPVVEGMARAKIDHRYGGDPKRLIPVLIHGDAAVAAQGVVYEVIQMADLRGYGTGGTIHMVINNQLGFTTNYLDGRSSTYCTDVAKVTLSPVFHVNADDVEAVVLTMLMALDYRQTFHSDVFVDLLGYRKYGHNESDEPRFTQPKLYKIIAKHPDPLKIYRQQLAEEGSIDTDESEKLEKAFREKLNVQLKQSRKKKASTISRITETNQEKPADTDFEVDIPTAVDREQLLDIGRSVFTIPNELPVMDKIRRLYDGALKSFTEKNQCDWAIGELLAYGTMLAEGTNIRLSGQDCERGTFSHRHAVLLMEDSEDKYITLNHIRDQQGTFQVFNSLLSEYAVLGFEYGYASNHPDGLTIWEAQFGDFANGAQVITDQYITSAEAKWNRANNLILYLPHGYEGQGPEHSSARMERYLNLCANHNMVVVNPTTPANLFHLLRRHRRQSFHIPMIVFTPKSLLRHPRCVSPVEDFCDGGFQPLIDDPAVTPAEVKRVILCSGKLYYELLAHQEENERQDTAVIRLERIYPLPHHHLRQLLDRYPNARNWIWAQEEPANMGAAYFVQRHLDYLPLELVARKENSSPATGFFEIHKQEQTTIIRRAFD